MCSPTYDIIITYRSYKRQSGAHHKHKQHKHVCMCSSVIGRRYTPLETILNETGMKIEAVKLKHAGARRVSLGTWDHTISRVPPADRKNVDRVNYVVVRYAHTWFFFFSNCVHLRTSIPVSGILPFHSRQTRSAPPRRTRRIFWACYSCPRYTRSHGKYYTVIICGRYYQILYYLRN